MITIHILQLLEENGLGTVAWLGTEAGADLFWEKFPADTTGIWIVSRGAPLARGQRTTQTFDLYARGTNDLDGMRRLEAVNDFFESIYGTSCELRPPENEVGAGMPTYTKAVIRTTNAISNVGQDATDRVVWNMAAVITYNK